METLLTTPYIIAIGATITVAIALIGFFIIKKKHRSGPLTPSSIPPLPTTGEADQHFATTHIGVNSIKKPVLSKNVLIGIAVLFNLLLIGSIIFIGMSSNKQNQGTHAKAAEDGATLQNAISKEENGSLVAGGIFTYTGSQPQIPVTVTVRNFHCDSNTVTTCNGGNGTAGQPVVVTENVGREPVTITGSVPMDQQCGSYQVDADYRPSDGTGQAGSMLKKFSTACADGKPSNTPIPTAVPSGAPQTCQISGQVLDIGVVTANPAQCPTVGGRPGDQYPGMNNVQVSIYRPGTDFSQTTTTAAGASGQNGTFYFPNMDTTGTYNVCVSTLPAGYANLCNVPRDDGINPFGTTCAKVQATKACSGIRLDLKKVPVTSPTPSPTVAPNTCQVSGQVLNITDTPAQCPTVGGRPGDPYAGMNGVNVQIFSANTTPGFEDIHQTTTTLTGPSGQMGAFYFQNIPVGGIYNICVQPMASGFTNYCNVPRSDNHDPFTTTCAKINTTQLCSGIRLDLKANTTPPSSTPTITPANAPTITPTPTCVPRPDCLNNGTCDIPTNPNYCPPTTPSITKPAATITPTVTPTLRPTATITPAGTATPTPTGTLTPTATPTSTQIVVYITATPTPGGTGQVVTTNTPAAVPTIPSVGNPLPAFAVLIPAVLMALAFLL